MGDIHPREHISFSMPGKITLEHSDSNSSAESGSSVGSDSTVSSKGSGGGSDGNPNNFHLPVAWQKLDPEMISGMPVKLYRAQGFGLSPPSESNLLRRRHKEEFDQTLSLTGKQGIVLH